MGIWDKLREWLDPPELIPPSSGLSWDHPPVEPKKLQIKFKPGAKDYIYTEKCHMLVEEANRWLHVREYGGSNKGVDVERFQKEVDGKANGEPWCLAFVQFCVNQVDRDYVKKTKIQGPDNWIFPTEHCLECWNLTELEARIFDELHPGLVVIWQYYKDGVQTSSGHAGIIKEVRQNRIITIEGNTRDRDSVVRDGDGVYLMERKLRFKGNFRIKGFLKPWDGDFIF